MNVLSFCRRLSAVHLTLALLAGQAELCAAWLPTPEARMACCGDDGPCDMHRSGSEHHATTRAVTQAEADRCCAVSDHDDSARSPSSVAFFVGLGVVLSPVPALNPEPEARTQIWRASVPVPTSHVAKHLLLSVFLV